MKIGDRLYCHTNINIVVKGEKERYCIVDFSDDFYIGGSYIVSNIYKFCVG